MSKPTTVLDPHGNYDESIQRIAINLGRSKLRTEIFNCIYGRGSRPKTVEEIMDKLGLSKVKYQTVLNELKTLSDRDIIVQSTALKPGSAKAKVNCYSKVKFISAHKEKILKLSGSPAAAKKMVTKRSVPQSDTRTTVRSRSKRSASVASRKTKILYLVSSPLTAEQLAVQTEVNLVQSALRGSKFRQKIEVHYRPAADLNSLIDGLNDLQPSIVHFSGHASQDGLLGDDSIPAFGNSSDISYELLRDVLAAVDHPPTLVILNACETLNAETMILEHCDAAVTMALPVGDSAAIGFALGFYAGVGAGQSLQSAFRQGKAQVKMVSPQEAETPRLQVRKGFDPKTMFLVR